MQRCEAVPPTRHSVLLSLCGDVMLGRGIDQILPRPCDPVLHEPIVTSALEYVRLAEAVSGPVPRAVAPDYVWGDALSEWTRFRPAARIINLETSVTKSAAHLPKGINYRMNPENVAVLRAAGIDCCLLANNHVLDYGRDGLVETLDALLRAGIKTAGAGRNLAEAEAPAIVEMPGGVRIAVFAFGHRSSGIPRDWAATAAKPGVALLDDFSDRTLAALTHRVRTVRQNGDILIASLHWGGNWGYEISRLERDFARGLIDVGFDVVCGHSSHHPKAIEIFRDRLILYGCGDFLNDYEGISGYEEFRGNLTLMYLPRLCVTTGKLIDLCLAPFRITRFRLQRACAADTRWLQHRLNTVSRPFGAGISLNRDGTLSVCWR